jgi:hypothetical protein
MPGIKKIKKCRAISTSWVFGFPYQSAKVIRYLYRKLLEETVGKPAVNRSFDEAAFMGNKPANYTVEKR